MTRAPYSIGADQTLASAARRMDELRIRHLPVLSGGRLMGIVSERDIALVESLPGVDVNEVVVSEAMTSDPFCVEANTPLESVVAEMAGHKWGTAIVTQDAKLVGVFTTTDALQALVQFLGGRAA